MNSKACDVAAERDLHPLETPGKVPRAAKWEDFVAIPLRCEEKTGRCPDPVKCQYHEAHDGKRCPCITDHVGRCQPILSWRLPWSSVPKITVPLDHGDGKKQSCKASKEDEARQEENLEKRLDALRGGQRREQRNPKVIPTYDPDLSGLDEDKEEFINDTEVGQSGFLVWNTDRRFDTWWRSTHLIIFSVMVMFVSDLLPQSRFMTGVGVALLWSLVYGASWLSRMFMTPKEHKDNDFDKYVTDVIRTSANPDFVDVNYLIDWRRRICYWVWPSRYVIRRVSVLGTRLRQRTPDERCYLASSSKLIQAVYEETIFSIEDFERDSKTYHVAPTASLHSAFLNIDAYKTPGLANHYVSYNIKNNTGINQRTFQFASSISGVGLFAETLKMTRMRLTQDDTITILNGDGGHQRKLFWVLAIVILMSPSLLSHSLCIRGLSSQPSVGQSNQDCTSCKYRWDQVFQDWLPRFQTSETGTQSWMGAFEGFASHRLRDLETLKSSSGNLFGLGYDAISTHWNNMKSWTSTSGWRLHTTLTQDAQNCATSMIEQLRILSGTLVSKIPDIHEWMDSVRLNAISGINQLEALTAVAMRSSASLVHSLNQSKTAFMDYLGSLNIFQSTSDVVIWNESSKETAVPTWQRIIHILSRILQRN